MAFGVVSCEVYIIVGEVATPHSEPHILSLKGTLPGQKYHFCGATLVSATHGITAAHCYKK